METKKRRVALETHEERNGLFSTMAEVLGQKNKLIAIDSNGTTCTEGKNGRKTEEQRNKDCHMAQHGLERKTEETEGTKWPIVRPWHNL
ncbi:hypothetical protein AVEN_211521-1 [Araneus ventricosus]|uniref:Uncharacterized protein n=1 Tax=Araneus ventricosus TaxID=182803 RepID=A0A4Y2PBJ6_ARAVE|nr:hypothetical protein AVEN_211521-1 [Araneus ventricosus]